MVLHVFTGSFMKDRQLVHPNKLLAFKQDINSSVKAPHILIAAKRSILLFIQDTTAYNLEVKTSFDQCITATHNSQVQLEVLQGEKTIGAYSIQRLMMLSLHPQLFLIYVKAFFNALEDESVSRVLRVKMLQYFNLALIEIKKERNIPYYDKIKARKKALESELVVETELVIKALSSKRSN